MATSHLRSVVAGAVHQARTTAARVASVRHMSSTVLPHLGQAVARLVPRGRAGAAGLPVLRRGPAMAGAHVRFLSDYAGATPLPMPALSPTMDAGTITKWYKQPGDALSPGDTICDITTDKAVVGFECQDEGFMAKHLLPEGAADVPIGTPIALMVEEESDVEAIAAASFPDPLDAASGAPSPSPSPAPAPAPAPAASSTASRHAGLLNDPTKVMPAARRVLLEAGLTGEGIQGTGRGGRITKGDALAAAGVISSAPTPAQAPAPTPAPAKQSAQAAAGAPVQHSLPGPSARPEGVAPGTFTDAKPSSMRKVIAARLTESKAKVPHFYVQGDCMIDSVTELRAQLASAGVKVSLNDIVIKAAALALRAVPEANAAFVPGEGRVKANASVDISVAVATPGGLITPIVKDADKKGLAAINAEVRDLATRGRAGKLAPEEYQGGTFTISNLGMFGITDFTAVINPPQACILAVGTGRQEAVLKVDAATGGDVLSAEPAPAEVAEEDVTFITNMAVQLSGDRRVVDESVAGQFIATFKHYMLNPLLLMA